MRAGVFNTGYIQECDNICVQVVLHGMLHRLYKVVTICPCKCVLYQLYKTVRICVCRCVRYIDDISRLVISLEIYQTSLL